MHLPVSNNKLLSHRLTILAQQRQIFKPQNPRHNILNILKIIFLVTIFSS